MAEHTLTLPATEASETQDRGSVLFIGNATVLIRCAGFTILTDPNFIHQHERVPLGFGLQAERLTDPALEIGELPPIDFIVLSHFHGDHFDEVAERELPKDVPIFTPPQAAQELTARGFTACHGLETWEHAAIAKGDARVRVTAAPGWHGPSVVGRVLPDVMGSVLEFESEDAVRLYSLYISGDTLIIDELHDIPERHSAIDLALLHLGGTRVFGITVTMDDEQGVEMMRIIAPELAIPIHFDDYDVFKSPISDFQSRTQDAGLAPRVQYLSRGESYEFSLRQ